MTTDYASEVNVQLFYRLVFWLLLPKAVFPQLVHGLSVEFSACFKCLQG